MHPRIPQTLAAAIAVACLIPTSQALAAPGDTITAVGNALISPTPADRNSDTEIAAAVKKAQLDVIPLAIADGRTRAQLLATASGLTLGTLTGIADQASPFISPVDYVTQGTFGHGHFCGTVGRYRITRLKSGQVQRTRIGSRRQCRIPQITASLSLTYTVLAAG